MKNVFFNTVGWIATLLGFLGVFLPLLPTVPFILLALYCFNRSSPEFRDWIENNRLLGDTVKRIKENAGLTINEKWRILVFSWISISLAIVFVVDSVHGRCMLGFLVLAETWFIVRYKTHQASC